MPIEVTHERAPITSVVITDTLGHRCVKIMPVSDGATVEHDPDHFVSTAFLDPDSLLSLAESLTELARDAESRVLVRAGESATPKGTTGEIDG